MKKVHLIGNAHIDPVWLWQWQEGYSEVKATFRSVLDRMKEFPYFKFTSACSIYYKWIEESDREMFDEIAARIKEGRWNIAGGWIIQPDCNIPCGESFARHSLIGQRYFKEKFGVTAKTGYNVDSFGHNGNIPKILRNSGMENYVFMRPGIHEKKLMSSLFDWESSDGSRVRAYRIPPNYCINDKSFQYFGDIENMAQNENHDMMAFYGIGNHGGGPTIQLLDKMSRELNENYLYSTVDEYFAAVKDEQVPLLNDDLQFHAKGCYSACSQVKGDNRKSENSLIECEKFSVLSNYLMNTPYPGEKLTGAWENVLFNQFHDILGGCSIREAYTDARYLNDEAMSIAQRHSNFALQQISWNIDTMNGRELKKYYRSPEFAVGWKCDEGLGTPLVVFNSLPYEVNQVVTVKKLAKRITDKDNNDVKIQTVRDSKTNGGDKWATAFIASVPAYGYTVYRMYFDDEADNYDNLFATTTNSIENGKIKITFSKISGEVISIYHKERREELLAAPTQTVLIDESCCDTWAHGIQEFDNVIKTAKRGRLKLTEAGPCRVTMRSAVKIGNSTVIRDYSLLDNSDEIIVKCRIDFREKNKMLKFRFPCAVYGEAFCQIPFGYIKRECDGKEQVGGSWMTVTDKKRGLVVTNDSKYSFDVDKNVMSLTVLRGAIYADHYGQKDRDEDCVYMEQGIHEFIYSLSAFKSISCCEKAALNLNNPVTLITETFHKGKLPTSFSGINVNKDNIIVTAIKKHEDSDGIIVRCVEIENRDTEAKIEVLGSTVTVNFTKGQVKTLLIKDGIAEQVNFMEWAK